MRKENGMPMVESKESSYKENEEEEVTRKKRERERESWYYEVKDVKSGTYMNVEGNVVEYDEGLEIKGDLGGIDLLT